MARPTIDQFYMSLLDRYASRSTCPRRHVACIITDEKGKQLSAGYNGVPSGIPHCWTSDGIDNQPCHGADDPSGDTSRCIAIHAEQNALLQCWRLDLAHNLYVHATPCFVCAKMICNTSIQRVCYFDQYADAKGLTLFFKKGIQLTQFTREYVEVNG